MVKGVAVIGANKNSRGAVFTAAAVYVRAQIHKIIKGQAMPIFPILFFASDIEFYWWKNRFSSKLCASLRYCFSSEYLSASAVGFAECHFVSVVTGRTISYHSQRGQVLKKQRTIYIFISFIAFLFCLDLTCSLIVN